MKKLILIIYGLALAASLSAQPLYVNPAQFTPFQLVDSILVTGCLQAYNVVYTGAPLAKGYFQRQANNFAFLRGVLLTSGSWQWAVGPNTGTGSGTSNGTGSDPQLASLISSSINDKCLIEFDFVPHGSTMEFRYIFGSEEYPEYVGSSFNDVFGFFISGPSTGCPNLPLNQSPNYMNYNIARIPGSGAPVSINNINQNTNTVYYVNNNFQTPPANNTAVGYDGYTVPLTASACVVPCQTYHIKLAIGDAGDSILDSGIFLEGGSLSSGNSILMDNYSQNGTNTNVIYEGCGGYYIFYRSDTADMSLPLNVVLNIVGTANPANDISGFPTTFQIPAGQAADTIFYEAIMDNVQEGTETLIFQLMSGCPCSPTLISDTIFIYDNFTLDGGIVQNDTLVCAGPGVNNVLVLLTGIANTPAQITNYEWSTGATTQNITVNVAAGQVTNYSLTITDDCGQLITDDIDITISNLNTYSLNVSNLACNAVCQGGVVITPSDGFAPYTFSWTPGGIGMTTAGVANNLCAGNYSVTITDAFGCQKSTPFTVTQPPATVIAFTSDSASCPGSTDGVLNATVSYGPGYSYPLNQPYVWGCSSMIPITDNDNHYSFQNLPAGTYTVNVIDALGCTASGIYTIGEKEMHYTTTITHVKCHGGSDGIASFIINGGTAPYSYSWNTGETSNHINQKPSGNYSCTVTDVSGCQIIVPVTINQPTRLEFSNSLDTIMCKGQQTTLSASAQGGTPTYHYIWTANGNQIGTGDLLAYSPSQTTTVTLTVSDNNGCVQPSHYIIVQVFPRVEVNLYTNDPVICSGETTTVYVDVTGGNGGPYTLTDSDGNIILPPFEISPTTDFNFTVTAADDCGSQAGSDVQVIQVEDPPIANIHALDSIGCAPFTTQFFETSADHGQTYLWQFGVTSGDISLSKNPVYTFDTYGTFDVSLTVTSEAGCSRIVEAKEMITVLPAPVVTILPEPPVTSSLNPVIFFNNDADLPLDSAVLYFGDGGSVALTNSAFNEVQHAYQDTGVFHAYLVGYSLDGCLDTAFTDVEVYAEHKLILVPNVINPLSSITQNQVFLPTGFAIDVTNFHLMIYNRWGELIFESTHGSIGWNGRMPNGELVKTDTYQWVLVYKDNIGKTLRESGNVTVIY